MATQPSLDDLRWAFRAGFQSMDDGHTFYIGFHAFLESSGFRKQEDIPCTCPDEGGHGHMPECRWVKG